MGSQSWAVQDNQAYLSLPCSDICNPLVDLANSKLAGNTLGCVFSLPCFSFREALPGFGKSSGSSHHFVPRVCVAAAVWPDQPEELLADYVLRVPVAFQDPSVCHRFPTAASPASRRTLGRGLLGLLALITSLSPSNLMKMYLVFRDLDLDLL